VPELLLEIGCEEIPAPWLPELGRQLETQLSKLAGAERLSPRELAAVWTPRRLALRAVVDTRQPDLEEQVFGPSLKVSRDASGAWSKAAQGFARKHGVTPEELQDAPKDPASPDERFLLVSRHTPGRPARDVLSGVFAGLLRSLSFPKRMSWDARLDDGKEGFPFGRPIRWLIAVLDGEVVPFTIHVLATDGQGDAPVESGRSSRGHRFLPREAAGRPVEVGSFADYVAKLEESYVIVEPERRERRIREGLEAAGATGAEVPEGLLTEWRDLVEYPTVVRGGVPEEFRRLPAEVLRTVLVHHQKYLPLADASGTVTGFAAVTNAAESAAPAIVRGMERVVVARLRDGAFFYDEDRKRALADRVADLAGVTLHQGLGSYADKAARLEALIEKAGAAVMEPAERADACRAARLAKADLTTLMVGEFPELQGVMGGLYLEAEGGAPAGVPEAVRWHYHPLSVDVDSAPAGQVQGRGARLFAAVSLADKLDTLAGYFGLGLVPTGSRDPFGLRRAGQGAVRVLLDFWPGGEGRPRPSLRRWVEAAAAGFAGSVKRSPDEIAEELNAFLLDRLRYVLGARGYPADEIEAVLGAREPEALDDLGEVRARIEALHGVRASAREDFDHLAVAFKRAKNILAEQAPPAVDPEAFQEEAERELHAAVSRLNGAGSQSYDAALRGLASLRAPVDRFFDDVLVMTDDRRLRENRQALLGAALALFYRIADISRLGG
jgi:glycyl-tRNA synthetase beta chain